MLRRLLALLCLGVAAFAQAVGPNVNMVAGTKWPDGDPFLQRQNEPSIAVSTRNPQHLLGGGNDYRSVDIPFPIDEDRNNGDAWLGYYTSMDGGQTWKSYLIPGYPQDSSPAGLSSPLKQYAVATDPTARAGTHGLFYMSGLVFTRGDKGRSGVFVTTFEDQNNKGNGDAIVYRNSVIVDNGVSGQFLDKPWIAVDIPRAGQIGSATCRLSSGPAIRSGNVYVVYSQFTGGDNNPHGEINLVKSSDCGATWTKPTKISEGVRLSQGTVSAIDPNTGHLYIAWRQMASGRDPDALIWVRSTDGARTFTKPEILYTFPAGMVMDQPRSATSFRALALPTMAIDAEGRVYVAWAERGLGPGGDARVRISTLTRGSTAWSAPYLADPTATGRGHQLMPALTYAYGRLALVFYDLREDGTNGELNCVQGVCTEVRVQGVEPPSRMYTELISDAGLRRRHTMDVRGALADPGPQPLFATTRVSQYQFGMLSKTGKPVQLSYNAVNLPMFVKGTRPFMGDYMDIAGLSFTLDSRGEWVYTNDRSQAPVFHAVWTDNRDVRPPKICPTPTTCREDWTQFTPVASTGGSSLYDPAQQRPACNPQFTGSRNQNLYTARLTNGLEVAVRENNKPLNPIQRAFSVTVRNATRNTAFYRLTIAQPLPAGTQASFEQFSSRNTIDIGVPARSTVARSVFVSSNNRRASVNVSVVQIASLNGTVTPGGQTATTVVNPDITNPDIVNPDIVNPDITNPDITNPDITNPDIATQEVYNPRITNPDIVNPDITNPDITNPDITNPDITNPDIVNPDITNPDIVNPDITNLAIVNPDIVNPDIVNPDITNPDIVNPDITNPDIASLPSGGITDFTWKLTNKGNTTSTYNTRLLLKDVINCCPAGCPGAAGCPASCYQCQLIVRRTYPTPAANGCSMGVVVQNAPQASIPSPVLSEPPNAGTLNAGGAPNIPSVSLAPGEAGRLTLRVFGLRTTTAPPGLPKPNATSTGANTGQTTPTTSLSISTSELPVAVSGAPYTTIFASVGGTGPTRTWSLFSGSFTGLTLSPAGALSTANAPLTAAPGTYTAIVQVIDSPTVATQLQVDRSRFALQVNRLSVASVSVLRNGSPAPAFLPAGQTLTVAVTVRNEGPATAVNVQTTTPQVVRLNGDASATCTHMNVTPLAIPSNSSVTVNYTCGATAGNGALYFTSTAAGQYTNTAGVTNALAAAVSSPQITIDSTPPVLSVAATLASGAAYTAGAWTNQTVSVVYSCVDNAPAGVTPSGSAGATGSQTFATDIDSLGTTGACSDNVGNAANALPFGPVRVDKTAPTLTLGAASPAANGNGWNNTDVEVPFAFNDNLSGIAGTPPSSPLRFTAEVANQTRTVRVTDNAGNFTERTVTGISIDKTAPTGNATYAASPSGWFKTDVSVSFECNDSLSGPVAIPAVLVTTEGPNQSVARTCADRAGNSLLLTATGISIDKTSPTLTGSAGNYTAGSWTNQDVAVTFTCSDALSQPAANQPTGNVTLTAETLGTLVDGSCADVAGNVTNVQFGPVRIDKTAPVLNVSAGGYVADTWTNQTVAVTFGCTDQGGSGVLGQPSGSQTFTTDTAGATANGACSDAAGNPAAPLSFGPVKIDKTPPVLTVSSGGYVANTWTNQTVTVTFGCTDQGGSGVAGSPTGSQTFTVDTPGSTANGACSDVAGNPAQALSFGPVKIDKTNPQITFVAPAPPAPAANGWYGAPVTVAFAVDAAISGVASAPASPLTFSTTGANQTQTVAVTDNAGNSASATSPAVSVDLAPPALSATAVKSDGSAYTAGSVSTLDVTVTFSCQDPHSGVATVTAPVVITGTTAQGIQVPGACSDRVGNPAAVTFGPVIVQKTAAPTIAFANFSGPLANLTRNGTTSQVDGNILRIGDSNNQTSSTWFNTAQVVGGGFTTSFQFRITPGPGGLGDGFAFVVQNSSASAYLPFNSCGSCLGYDPMPNSLAVEFDTYFSAEDSDGQHIAVHSNGAAPNSYLSSARHGFASATFADGNVHTATIRYAAGVFSVYLDNASTPLFTAAYNLSQIGLGAGGTAWVGFTAGTGDASQNTDLLSWTFTPGAN